MGTRLTTKRLEAVIDAASRGIDEMEMEGDRTEAEIEIASAGLDALHALLRKRNESKGDK
jgi:hypothetical protein